MPEAGAAPACLSLGDLRLGSPGCSFLSSAARSRSCRWFLSESDATSAGFRELWPAPQALVAQSRLHPAGGDAAGNDRAAGYSVVEVRLGVTPRLMCSIYELTRPMTSCLACPSPDCCIC